MHNRALLSLGPGAVAGLIQCGRDAFPESGILHSCDLLVRVGVEVDTEQQTTEGSSKAIGEVFVLHAPVKRKWDEREEWKSALAISM